MNERIRRSVVVSETGTGRYVNRVVAGAHEWLADEPASAGGEDAGPAPFEMLAAALGACTSMTVRMYAERKQLALAHVAVEVRHDRVDGGDRFHRVITLAGELTDEQRASILSIANRCPVHRTLERGSEIVTGLG